MVVIDSRVEDKQSLINDLAEQRDAGRAVSWLIIEADQDGLSVIGAALQNSGVVDALHLVAHGQPGELQLGTSTLNIDSVRLRAGELSQWSGYFSEHADLLVYGCDLAAGETGLQLVDALSAITGADVAASVDLTGSNLLGGNWELERSSGLIESGVAFTQAEQLSWQYLLNVVPTGTPDLINAGTTGTQSLPDQRGSSQATALPGGNAFVVWHSAQDNEIYGRFLDAAGAPTGADILISSNAGNTSDPAVAFDATSSKIVVVWAANGPDGNGNGIFSRTFTLAGAGSAVTQINDLTAGNQYQPALAVRNGIALISWTDDQAYSKDTIFYRAQVINSLFLFPDSVFSETNGGHNRTNSAIAYADSGDFIITWQSDSAEDGSGSGIFARAINPFGIPHGAEFQVNTSTAGNQLQPTVIGTSDGNYVVAWTDENVGDDVMAQRISQNGALIGGEFRLNSYLPDKQSNVHLAATPSSGSNVGGFVATWQSKNQSPDSSGYGIFAREFYGDGRVVGAEYLVNDITAGEQQAPSVIVNGIGGLVIWSGAGSGDATGVFARSFDLIEPQLTVNALAGLTETTEGGGTVILRYRLTTEPTANVVVTLTSDDIGEGSPLTNTLTFTPANWNVVQNVTVRGIDDAIVDGQISFNVRASIASADAQYGVLPPVDIALSNLDDDNQNFIVVTTASDIEDGDISSISNLSNNQGADGKTSLREAIRAANNTANGAGGLDTILFDPALGTFSIGLNSALPAIDQPIYIDGISFTAYTIHPVITLTRASGAFFDGLVLAAGSDGSKIEGLAINGFNGAGIAILSDGNTIRFNHVGVNDVGSAAIGNSGNGIQVTNADDNIIRNNVISGNGSDGIFATSSNRLMISGNTIGVNAARTAMIGNASDGIILNDSNQAVIDGNLIGGNSLHGIRISGAGSFDNQITANGIGTDAFGSQFLPNSLDGVAIDNGASNNMVGGLAGRRRQSDLQQRRPRHTHLGTAGNNNR